MRLLIAIDEGKASEMAGKSLADISLEGIVSICLLFIEKLQKLSIFHDFWEIPINGITEFYEILFLTFMLGITKAIWAKMDVLWKVCFCFPCFTNRLIYFHRLL